MQKVIFIRKFRWPMRIITLLALLTTLVITAGSALASAPPQYNEFRFTSDAHSSPAQSYTTYIQANDGSGNRGSLDLPCGNYIVFGANQPANTDVVFTGTTFTFQTPARAYTMLVYVFELRADGGLESLHDNLLTAGSTSVDITPPSLTIRAGNYLASAIGGEGCSGTRPLDTSSTTLTYSPSSPAYPTPELGTLVLAAAGIIGAGAFVAFRRFR